MSYKCKAAMILGAGTTLYKRSHKSELTLKDDRFFWCTIEDPNSYGPILHEYTTTKPITLIDVTTKEFRAACKGAIDSMVTDENDRKIYYLPFGLDGYENTKGMLEQAVVDKEIPRLRSLTEDQVRRLHRRFDGCMRSSITRIDVQFTTLLQHLIGKTHDGYISQVNMPGLLHGDFPPEICIFNPVGILEHVSSEAAIPPRMQNGGSVPKTYEDAEFWVHDGSKTVYLEPEEEYVPERPVYHDAEFWVHDGTKTVYLDQDGNKSPTMHGGSKKSKPATLIMPVCIGIIGIMALFSTH